MNNLEFVQRAKDIAHNYKTLYVMGCIGAPMSAANKKRYCVNHSFNKNPSRVKMIQAASADTFGFDCVCLIKSILWGWKGDRTKTYGGAIYNTSIVPDISADQMITKCHDISTNFSDIEIGEVVWLKGHIGIYIGDGLVVESSPAWKNGVQITACNCNKSGYNRRNWTKHGKLPYINYIANEKTQSKSEEVCDVEVGVLKRNAKGNAVKALQILLIGNGYSCGTSGVDGSFGPGTEAAVKSYQKAKGLTPDGCVGKNTWVKLLGVK